MPNVRVLLAGLPLVGGCYLSHGPIEQELAPEPDAPRICADGREAAPEVCGDGADQDCDGLDPPCPVDACAGTRALATEVFGPEDQIVRVFAVPGSAPERIVDMANDLGCDLIVVGTSGKGAVARVLLGSTTAALLRSSPIPVLAVH